MGTAHAGAAGHRGADHRDPAQRRMGSSSPGQAGHRRMGIAGLTSGRLAAGTTQLSVVGRPAAPGRGRTGTGHRRLGRASGSRIVGHTPRGCARSTSDCRPVLGRRGGAAPLRATRAVVGWAVGRAWMGGPPDRRARRASGSVLERPARGPRARS